ncbi:MAG: DUF11 domain-containing protein [Gemmatimonadaceae bacterium]
MMNSRRHTVSLVVVLIASACTRDEPTALPLAPDVLSASGRAAPTAACTRQWATAVSGSWSNALRWSPVGVPQATDVVCIDAVGRYTVTVNTVVSVREVQLGDGTSPAQLTVAPAAQLQVNNVLRVKAQAVLEAQGCPLPFGLASGAVIVDGTIQTAGPCTTMFIPWASLTNRGRLSFPISTQLLLATNIDVQNSGTINVNAPVTVDLTRARNFVMSGGAVIGSSTVTLLGNWAGAHLNTFVWTAGTLGEQIPGGPPVVQLSGTDLQLGASTLVGTIAMSDGSSGTQLTGDIGASLRVIATNESGNPFVLSSGTSAPLVVSGTLELARGSTSANATYSAPTGIVNANTIHTHAGPVTLQLDSLVNDGALTLDDTLYVGGFGSLLRNRGTVNVNGGQLKLVGGRLASAGTIVGPASYANAFITGWGDVGDATLKVTTVDPGDAITNTFQTLSFSGLVLDALSLVTLDVGGTTTGTYDRLLLNGPATVSGTLSIRTKSPFVGGVCGQSIPVLQAGAGGSINGQFAALLGMNPSPGHAWRATRPTPNILLAGYDPTVQISQSTTALTTTEGQPATAAFSLCLKNAPVANVTIATSTQLNQVIPLPNVFSATPLNWELPFTSTVTAFDDNIVDPPMTDSLRFGVSSSDPAYNNVAVPAISAVVIDNDGNADLALSIPVPPPSLTLGQVFSATFRSTNNGPTLSTGASLTIPVPSGFKFLSASGATCHADAFGLVCQVPGSASGAFVDWVITAQAKAVGTFPVTMTLTGDQPDANAANNILLRNIVVH